LPELRGTAPGGQGLSRYVEVEVEATLDELLEALGAHDLEVQQGVRGRRVMLEGSLECAGQPVDVRLVPGTLGAVEDFGFVLEKGKVRMVCGDVDLKRLENELLVPLTEQLAAARVASAAASLDLETETLVEADGTRRIVVRRK
jgi:hypothetical protein